MPTKLIEVYEINGKAYPVIDYVTDIVNGMKYKHIPRVDMPIMSDYRWQMDALKSRLEHPEHYESFEDVPRAIERLRRWLRENERLATPQELLLTHSLLAS